MLVNELFIYIELHKTGCTHTRNILQMIPGFNTKIIGKHTTYDALPKESLAEFNLKIKIGNIRNPWDWYISLWSFGCMKKGMLYRNLTKKPYWFSKAGIKQLFSNAYKRRPLFFNISRIPWKKLYSDSNKEQNFRKWLKLLLTVRNIDDGENYKNTPISNEIGLLSFRYIKLYTFNGEKSLATIKDFPAIIEHDSENNFMDIILRNESLHNELLKNRLSLGVKKDKLMEILDNFQERSNSSRRNQDIEYYDKETYKLVQEKEKLIIEKYEYDYEL